MNSTSSYLPTARPARLRHHKSSRFTLILSCPNEYCRMPIRLRQKVSCLSIDQHSFGLCTPAFATATANIRDSIAVNGVEPEYPQCGLGAKEGFGENGCLAPSAISACSITNH